MNVRTLIFSSLAVAFALAQPIVAQASDDCMTPTVITGTGVFAFDATSATTGTQGQANPICQHIGHDVWFQWVAPQTGSASFFTCGQTAFDTDIAAYFGPGCPIGPTNACDDDACGLESFVVFQAIAGNTYMLQIGASGGGPPGAGTFTLNIAGPPANDDCSTPVVLGSQGGASYDNTQATTSPQGIGSPCGGIARDLWYTWTAPQSGSATLDTCGQSADDTEVAIWSGSGCPVTSTPIVCDDNGCGFQSMATWPIVAGVTYTLEVGNGPSGAGTNGSFIITVTGGGSSGTPYCFGDGSGTACPCGNSGASGNGCANSVNPGGANLDATGTVSVSADSVVLTGTGMPPNSAALYFQGTQQTSGGSGIVFGDGLRCVSGTVVRLGIRFNDASGASGYGGPLGDTPVSTRGQVPAGGGVREYQAWYRNAANFCLSLTFNLSNGLEITWAP